MERLYDELGAPSAQTLRFALQREGLPTRGVEAFVRSQQERQVFKQVPPSDGKSAPMGVMQNLYTDLIDLYAFGSTERAILVLLDGFTRKVALQAVLDKKPETVAVAFQEALQRLRGYRRMRPAGAPDIKTLSSDAGYEYTSKPFQDVLERRNLVHKIKRAKNSISLVDRAIQTIKKQIFRRLARRGDLKWAEVVLDVEKAYNNSPHAGVFGGTPNDIAKNDETGQVLQFMQLQKTARALQYNDKLERSREQKLRAEGAFRPAVRVPFGRSFKPRWGEKKDVANVSMGQVRDQDGQLYPTNNVQPVPRGGEPDRALPDFSGRAQIETRFRENLRSFADELHAQLSDRWIGKRAALAMMSARWPQARPKKMSFEQWLGLYPNLFEVEGNRVRRAPPEAAAAQGA
jgi:hypothetical protein